MKAPLATLILLFIVSCQPNLGPQNVGREYGAARMPLFITHIAEKNQRMLRKGTSPKHNVFSKILCFKFACRNEARRNHNLHAISYRKFKKKVAKNAKKGEYDHLKRDSVPVKKAPVKKPTPKKVIPVDTAVAIAAVAPLKADSLIILNEFSFETNSATLRSEHFSELDSIITFLADRPTLIIEISGHTDNTGREQHNMHLSTNRAKVVAEYIIGNGIDIGRVTFRGFGSSQPIAPNDTPQGRAKNRRVEILIRNEF